MNQGIEKHGGEIMFDIIIGVTVLGVLFIVSAGAWLMIQDAQKRWEERNKD